MRETDGRTDGRPVASWTGPTHPRHGLRPVPGIRDVPRVLEYSLRYSVRDKLLGQHSPTARPVPGILRP